MSTETLQSEKQEECEVNANNVSGKEEETNEEKMGELLISNISDQEEYLHNKYLKVHNNINLFSTLTSREYGGYVPDHKNQFNEKTAGNLNKVLQYQHKLNKISNKQSIKIDYHPRLSTKPKLLNSAIQGNDSFVSRLRLKRTLNKHTGCVNTINWSPDGKKLITGADDTNLILWHKPLSALQKENKTPNTNDSDICDADSITFSTGHSRNIFCAKFVPLRSYYDPFSSSRYSLIVSCAADGEVRLNDISVMNQNYNKGILVSNDQGTSKLLKEMESFVFQFDFLPCCPSAFISTQPDDTVRLFDIRQHQQQNGSVLINLDATCGGASSISFHPLKDSTFVIGCKEDPILRMYDWRYIPSNTVIGKYKKGFVACYCPTEDMLSKEIDTKMDEANNSNSSSRRRRYFFSPSRQSPGVTGVKFSSDGHEIVATYSGDNVYLFKTNCNSTTYSSSATTYAEKFANATFSKMNYCGRRNTDTFLKEVAFFCNNEYVVTGSDCGNLFVWNKRSGDVVRRFRADGCIVNGVAPHPFLPVIATCGIDNDAKIWDCGDVRIPLSSDTHRDPMSLLFIDNNSSAPMIETDYNSDEDDSLSFYQRCRKSWKVRTDDDGESLIEKANEIRSKGNQLFINKDYDSALDKYAMAIELLSFHVANEILEKERNLARNLCLLNKAACLLKKEDYHQVIRCCTTVLSSDADNVKALFRRAQAYLKLKKFSESQDDVKKALKLNPNDKQIQKLAKTLNTKLLAYKQAAAAAFSKMFDEDDEY